MELPLLYKYLDIQGARRTLTDRTFRHAKPDMYKDTEELSVRGVFPEEDEAALNLVNNGLIDVLLQHIDEVPKVLNPKVRLQIVLMQKMLKAYPHLADQLKAQIKNGEGGVFDLETFKNFNANAVANIKIEMQKWRILCVTQAFDSETMWSGYAEGHQGIVLRIVGNTAKDSKFARFKPVSYKEARPTLYKSAATFFEEVLFSDIRERTRLALDEIVYTKTMKYKEEHEYRLAISVGSGEKDWTALGYHPDEIVELYLGKKASERLKAEYVTKALAVNPKIKIFDMQRDGQGKLTAQPR